MEAIHFLLPLKLAGGNLTATGSGTEVSLKYAASPAKREMLALCNVYNGAANVASDTYAIDIKLQESATTVDSDFTDITGAAFTQITEAAAAFEAIYFQTDPASKFLREYHTVTGGTGTCAVATDVSVFLVKRSA